MTWTGRQRLEALADYLEKTDFAPGKFHMSMWMAAYDLLTFRSTDPVLEEAVKRRMAAVPHDAPLFEDKGEEGILPIECRTAGCAVGWGIVGIPAFREQGLKLQRWADHSATVTYANLIDYSAVAGFFELDQPTTRLLFSSVCYSEAQRTDPKAVARRIRIHLAKVNPPSQNA